MDINFQTFIKNGTTNSIGRFGEILFNNISLLNRWNCQKAHKEGTDYISDLFGNIDIKVVRTNGKKRSDSFRKYPKNKQLSDVKYSYVIFWDDCIELVTEFQNIRIDRLSFLISNEIIEKTWREFDKSSINLASNDAEYSSKIKKELKFWIKHEWSLNPRIIHRGDKLRNDQMIARGWGADNFYEFDSNKFDLVVLLHIDNSSVYLIYAYPTSCKDRISWTHKNIGPNPTTIMGFDPRKLDQIFIFDSLDIFKKEFRQRFLLNQNSLK